MREEFGVPTFATSISHHKVRRHVTVRDWSDLYPVGIGNYTLHLEKATAASRVQVLTLVRDAA